MATAPIQTGLPILYQQLVPLSSNEHASWGTKALDGLPILATTHAVPVIVDEFIQVQRFFPIIFADAEVPVPLALMGLNEGVNTFVDEKGQFTQPVYAPAYIRRYPFMLAQLGQNPDELSLCFDPSAGAVAPDGEAQKLFENGQATEATKNILSFCESFEQSAQRTGAFVSELQQMDLLQDGEVAIQPEGAGQPYIYRGFKMVNEDKLKELRGDQLRKMQQTGMLQLIYAHLYSLDLMREIFGRQMAQGKVPPQAPALNA